MRDVYATTETGPIAIDGELLAGVEVQERAGELWMRSPLLADGYLDDPGGDRRRLPRRLVRDRRRGGVAPTGASCSADEHRRPDRHAVG